MDDGGFGHVGSIGPNSSKPIWSGLEGMPQTFKPLIPFVSMLNNMMSAMQGVAGAVSLQNVSLTHLFNLSPTPFSGKMPGLLSGKGK